MPSLIVCLFYIKKKKKKKTNTFVLLESCFFNRCCKLNQMIDCWCAFAKFCLIDWNCIILLAQKDDVPERVIVFHVFSSVSCECSQFIAAAIGAGFSLLEYGSCHKLQALLYDILPSTTGLRHPSFNHWFTTSFLQPLVYYILPSTTGLWKVSSVVSRSSLVISKWGLREPVQHQWPYWGIFCYNLGPQMSECHG